MRPQLEIADIVRRHRSAYVQRHPIGRTRNQARALDAIENCRTAALGGHQQHCEKCDQQRNSYNSCRNRHCPKCQNGARQRWLAERQRELLPIPYFHVVFTIPHCLSDIALQNKAVVYNILFRAASSAMLKVGANPKHLGGQVGFLAVLHTWGQNLQHHPHLHCIVPAGSLSKSGGDVWIQPRSEGFLLPVRVLSRLFRGLFLSMLRKAHLDNELEFHGNLADYRHFEAFCLCIREAKRTEWVVYAKRPFGGPETVLAYLGRYTHKVAISNQRLVEADDKTVSFRWKDYRSGQRDELLKLDGVEFLRRFLLHTLPDGFVRIRHYGFLANRYRQVNLARCRACLGVDAPASPPDEPVRETAPCSRCESIEWTSVRTLLPARRPLPLWRARTDSS